MRNPFQQLNKTRKLENAIFVSIILFIVKIIVPSESSFTSAIISEIAVYFTLFLWTSYIIDFIHSRVDSPLSLILNAGILTALIFFILSIAKSFFNSPPDFSNTGFVVSIFYSLIAFVFIGALTYIFSTFRELFFLRQKRDPKTYFNIMVWFFTFAFFANLCLIVDPDIDYPKDAFFVVSIVLISINSLRVAWIAFLPKKQKLYLLIISTVLSVLFGLNFALITSESMLKSLLINFSPGLQTLLALTMIYGAIYFGVIFFTALFHLPTAEAFDRKAEEVSSLMDLSKLITQVFDFKELADTITTITTKVCNSDSAWLVTNATGEYELSAVNNIGYVEADKITNALLVEESYNINEVKVVHKSSIKINIRNDVRTFAFKSIAIAPLKVHNATKGFLFAARKQDYNFDDDEIKAIGAYADYAAVALENAKLIAESIEKERLEKELDVAREIQHKIVPSVVPEFEHLKISALFVPAFEVGGDYYDFFELHDDKLGFVVADVSGKGISAAFIMAEVKGIFETLSKLIESPKDLLIKANEILKNSLEKKNFVTAIYGIVDTKLGKLTFARVGHTPAIYLNNGKTTRLAPPGIGLGLDYGINFASTIKELEIELNNNDIIAFYSDGITEAKNSAKEDFGYERFENILMRNQNAELDELSKKIMQELTMYSQDTAQHDDITLVLFKWVFKNKKVGVI